jgi:predicted enzyme related to lactoylglutathione lyase
MAAHVNQFIWYELATTDVEAAKVFYADVIGWKAEPFDGANEPYTMWVTDGGPVGGLMLMPEAAKQQGAPPHWVGYVGVVNVDAAADKAVGLGATLIVPPTDIPNAGRFAVIFDPQMASLCLFQPLQDEKPMWDHPSKPGRISWHELTTTDPAGAWTFYENMFGWQKTEAMDMGDMGAYQMFSTTGDRVHSGGIMNMPPGAEFRSNWMYYIAVADLDHSLARVTALGGTVLSGPMEVPGGSGDRMAQCKDPQGAAFALHWVAA